MPHPLRRDDIESEPFYCLFLHELQWDTDEMHVSVLKHGRSIRIIIYTLITSFNIIFKSRTMKRPIGQEQEERKVKVRFRYHDTYLGIFHH